MSGGKIPPLFLYPSKFSISVNFSSNTFNATVLKDLTGGKRLKKQRLLPAPFSINVHFFGMSSPIQNERRKDSAAVSLSEQVFHFR
jgi:hypothetical protein